MASRWRSLGAVAAQKKRVSVTERSVVLYALWLRLWHWLHALCFAGLVATGLSLHYGEMVAALPFRISVLAHDVFGIALGALYLLYAAANALTANVRHYINPTVLSPRRLSVQLKYYMIGIFRGDAPPYPRSLKRKFNPAQAAAYALVMYVFTPLSAISGGFLLFPELAPAEVAGAGGVWPMALLHLATAYGLTLFVVVHIYMITTGPKAWSYLAEMITGRAEVEDEAPSPAE
jgi:thiosulfate reductase cytochrome b subunit